MKANLHRAEQLILHVVKATGRAHRTAALKLEAARIQLKTQALAVKIAAVHTISNMVADVDADHAGTSQDVNAEVSDDLDEFNGEFASESSSGSVEEVAEGLYAEVGEGSDVSNYDTGKIFTIDDL
jgi:hypothetical protein